MGYGRSRRLRPSTPFVLPRLPRHSHLLCCRLPRLSRQRARKGMLFARFMWQVFGRIQSKTNSISFVQWISEVLHFCPGLPIILVGCKKDLRYDQKTLEELHKTSQKPVTPEQVNTPIISFGRLQAAMTPISWVIPPSQRQLTHLVLG